MRHGVQSRERVPYYQYQPPNIMENENWMMLCDRTVLTDHTVEANRPDIVLRGDRKKKVWLIDIAFPNNDLHGKHAKKISKYSQLAIETQ